MFYGASICVVMSVGLVVPGGGDRLAVPPSDPEKTDVGLDSEGIAVDFADLAKDCAADTRGVHDDPAAHDGPSHGWNWPDGRSHRLSVHGIAR